GSASNPSLNFSSNTSTGISCPSANTLTFSSNGSSRITVSSTQTTNSNQLVQTGTVCFQAIQSITPTSSGSATVNSTTGIVLLRHSSNVTNFTLTLPSSPVNGQLLTIALATTNSITLIYVTTPNSIINAI